MKRAQIATEYLLAIGIVFLSVVFLVGFSFQKNIDVRNQERDAAKMNECLHFSNLISSVYTSGEKTVADAKTNFIVTIYNGSILGVKDVKNVTKFQTKIAVGVSEAGESTQSFYDTVQAALHPAWYKVCFNDIDGPGCQSTGTDVNYSLIPLNQSQLLCSDLSNFNVLYLEDQHIHPEAVCADNQTYIQKLQQWISSGNVAIFAEHPLCREQSSGSYTLTSYQCNPAGDNNDVWPLFGNSVHQIGGNFENIVKVINQPDAYFFPNLHLNDTFDFQEPSYIENTNISSSTRLESETMNFQGGFGSSNSCTCNSPSQGLCMRNTGSTSTYANATFSSPVNGTYTLKVNYCGESDGNDQWNAYKNGQLLSNWTTSGGEPNWQTKNIQNILLNSTDQITLSCKRGTSNSYCRSDYVDLTSGSASPFTVIGTYTSNNQPAIAYWQYGSGRVFYFGDFEVGQGKQTVYSGIIADLIQKANYLFFVPGLQEVTCSYFGVVKSAGEYTGLIRFQQKENGVFLTQR
ncbi:hypothetical protein HZB00_03180 [Candidatus Woesearchaeota archaeon]|nr:hypothetical protein [Candidatus Woesearchaeota archaeon]